METDALIEELADSEHERWSRWMRYMFSSGEFSADGKWLMPEGLVARWIRQADTSYSELSEAEKESDRKEARRTVAIVLMHQALEERE